MSQIDPGRENINLYDDWLNKKVQNPQPLVSQQATSSSATLGREPLPDSRSISPVL